MALKKHNRPTTTFTRAISRELADPQRQTVAIMALSLGCPKNLFARTHARFVRETVALLPTFAPAFETMDIHSDQIFVVLHGHPSELMELVNETHHGLVVLEAKYPESLRFCMSLTVAKISDTVDSLLDRAHDMLTDAMVEFA